MTYPTIYSRKLGRFKIRGEMIRGHPEQVIEAFTLLKMLPVDVKFSYDTDSFDYLAMSERFETVPQGYMANEYILEMTADSTGHIELVEVRKL